MEQTVRRLKQITAYLIWKENKDYLKNFYWAGKNTLWTNGYFISTIGPISEENLKNILMSNDNDNMDFKKIYESTLKEEYLTQEEIDPMKSNDDVKSDFEESEYSDKDQVSYDSSI